MAHSYCEWTRGCADKCVRSLENMCHTWAFLRWRFTAKKRYIKCMRLIIPLCIFNAQLLIFLQVNTWSYLHSPVPSFSSVWPFCTRSTSNSQRISSHSYTNSNLSVFADIICPYPLPNRSHYLCLATFHILCLYLFWSLYSRCFLTCFARCKRCDVTIILRQLLCIS